MKVAITTSKPTLEGTPDPKFGRSRYLFVVDIGTGQAIVHDTRQKAGAVCTGSPHSVWKAMEEGVDAVISGSVGPKAIAALRRGGVGVCLGAHGTVRDAVRQFKQGRLVCINRGHVEGRQVSAAPSGVSSL